MVSRVWAREHKGILYLVSCNGVQSVGARAHRVATTEPRSSLACYGLSMVPEFFLSKKVKVILKAAKPL